MKVVLFSFWILAILAVVCEAERVKRGFCITVCDTQTHKPCPSGYECQSNGCGHVCSKTTFVQPLGCEDSMENCDAQCLLGYKRNEDGCEVCECDYSNMGKKD